MVVGPVLHGPLLAGTLLDSFLMKEGFPLLCTAREKSPRTIDNDEKKVRRRKMQLIVS